MLAPLNHARPGHHLRRAPQYLELVADIIKRGVYRPDRTGTGTYARFGCSMRFNLRHTFPLLTSKRTFWRGACTRGCECVRMCVVCVCACLPKRGACCTPWAAFQAPVQASYSCGATLSMGLLPLRRPCTSADTLPRSSQPLLRHAPDSCGAVLP